jgi:phosphoserine phosphatase
MTQNRAGFGFTFLIVTSFVISLTSAQAAVALDPKVPWFGDNREQLDDMLARYGNKGSAGYDAQHPPVATFDWDNTIARNDVGDAMTIWLVANGKIHAPLKSWSETNAWLSDRAAAQLDAKCAEAVRLGKSDGTVRSNESPECADAILSIYMTHVLLDGKTSAWKPGFNADLVEPAYAWSVLLTAGYTTDEIRGFARRMLDQQLGAEVGAKQRVGTHEYPGYLRIFPQILELFSGLAANGFQVWVVSASAQTIVEEFARRDEGLQKKVLAGQVKILGVRPILDSAGRITRGFRGCGGLPDGQTGLITYRQGKRCWINQEIFKIRDPKKQLEARSATTFAAGDSDTDIFFLKDARVRLVMNQNKPELMCNAYNQTLGGHWIINPAPIDPKPPKAEPYHCAPFGLPDVPDTAHP